LNWKLTAKVIVAAETEAVKKAEVLLVVAVAVAVAKRAAVVALLEITSAVHQMRLCILKAKATAAAGKEVAV